MTRTSAIFFGGLAILLICSPAKGQAKEKSQEVVRNVLDNYRQRNPEGALKFFSQTSPTFGQQSATIRQLLPGWERIEYSDLRFDDWQIEEGAATFLCSYRLLKDTRYQRFENHVLSRIAVKREGDSWYVLWWTDDPNLLPTDKIGQAWNMLFSAASGLAESPDISFALVGLPEIAFVPLVEKLNDAAIFALQGNGPAIPWNRAALALARKINDPVLIALSLTTRALLQNVLEQYVDAVKSVEEGLQALGSNKQSVTFFRLNEQGAIAQVNLGQYDRAQRYIEASIAIFDLNIHFAPIKANLLATKCTIQLLQRNTIAAVQTAYETIAAASQTGTIPDQMAAKIMLGRAFWLMGKLQEAESTMRAGLDLAPAKPDGTWVEYNRLWLVWLLANTGHYARAMVELEKSRRVASVTNDPILKELCFKTLTNLFDALRDVNLAVAAAPAPTSVNNGQPVYPWPTVLSAWQRFSGLQYFQEAEAMYAEQNLSLSRTFWPNANDPGSNREDLENQLRWLAAKDKITPDIDVFKNIMQFMPITEPKLRMWDGYLIDKTGQLIQTLALLGRKDEALIVVDQLIRRAKAYNSDRVLGQILLDIAYSLAVPDSLDEAEKYLAQAEALNPNLNSKLDCLMVRGKILEKRNKLDDATNAYRDLIARVIKMRTQNGDASLRMNVYQRADAPTYRLCRILVMQGKFEDAFAAIESLKARSLADEIQFPGTVQLKPLTPDQKDRLQLLDEQIKKAQNAIVQYRVTGNLGDSLLRDFELTRARIQRDLYLQGIYLADQPKVPATAFVPIASSNLRQILRKGNTSSLLLSYIGGDDGVIGFSLRPTPTGVSLNARYIPIGQKALSEKISEFRFACGTLGGARRPPNSGNLEGDPKEKDFKPSGRWLYERLIKPFEQEMAQAQQVIISPDKDLINLPFQALLDSSNRFLIQKVAISYAPSATVLGLLSAQTRGNGQIPSLSAAPLVIGNPTTTADLDPLPGSEVEANEIAGKLGTSPLVRDKATISAVRERIANASLIHMATHGILAAPADYSALALAGSPGEDGMLEVREIRRMRLKARLVVLSACDTALGQLKMGEGTMGLLWSFLAAGSPTVVATQWRVTDVSATLLMDDFYERLRLKEQNVTAAQCLAEAVRQVLRDDQGKHPYYWAHFIIVGDANW